MVFGRPCGVDCAGRPRLAPQQEMRLRGGGNGVAEPQLGRPGALLGPLRPPGGPGEPGNLPARLRRWLDSASRS